MFDTNKYITFDELINNCTCSPITINDFRNYLIYRHADENLDYYIWYINYCKKFEKLEKEEKDLSPDFVIKDVIKDINPDNQPYRKDINNIIKLFFTNNSRKELNISQKNLSELLIQYKYTTNPIIFKKIFKEIDILIRYNLFQDYINIKSNSITSFTKVWRISMGIFLFIIYCLFIGLMYYKNVSRWVRLSLSPFLLYVIGLLVFSYIGVCSILNLQKRRELMIWEKENKFEREKNFKYNFFILFNIPIRYNEFPIMENKELLKIQNMKIKKAIFYTFIIFILLLIITLIIPNKSN